MNTQGVGPEVAAANGFEIRVTDDQGNLNPMRLFDEDDELGFGLYPFLSLVPALTGVVDAGMLQGPQGDAAARVELKEAVSWEAWMAEATCRGQQALIEWSGAPYL